MLDEILEYQQYSFDIDQPDDHVQRLKRSTLLHKEKKKNTFALNGLNRVLTIIARHFLYEVYEGEDHIKEKTIDALKSWLGHKLPDASANVEVHKIYKWLSLYVEKILLTESLEKLSSFVDAGDLSVQAKSELNTMTGQLSGQIPLKEKMMIAARLKNRCKELSFIPGNDRVDDSVFNCVEFLFQLPNRKSFHISGYADSGESNTANAITYDRILGNARRAGTLKRYYLACANSQIGSVEKKSKRKLKSEERDIVLKLTAYCMLILSRKGTQQVHETKTISVTEADFINWIINRKCDKEKQQSFFYKGEVIFEDPSDQYAEKSKYRNTKWMRLNQHWLEDSGFEILIDDADTDVIGDFLKTHPQGSVFMDKGAGVPLLELTNE